MNIEDPIVDEVRAAGRKLQEMCGNDVKKFSEMLSEKKQKRHKEGFKTVSFEELKNRSQKVSSF